MVRKRDEGIADQHPAVGSAQSLQISGDRNGEQLERLRNSIQLSAFVAYESEK